MEPQPPRDGRKSYYLRRGRSANGAPGGRPNGGGIEPHGVENRASQRRPGRGPSKRGKQYRNGLNGFHQNGSNAGRASAINAGEGSGDAESQDADYGYIPGLNDELALLCLARTSRAEYGKLFTINKRYLSLSMSGDLYKMRREIGVSEQWVYMLASGQFEWRALDPKSGRWRSLPGLPSDMCFAASDKESVCAGTHLLVVGKEVEGLVIWRYELVSNRWYKGPPMITPRCLFASASCGDFAFVAGGLGANRELLKSAEKYDPDKKTWEPLPDMHKERQLCSGCYMDNRFYVIGGKGENGDLTCGEFYDFERNTWELIPDMIPPGISSSVHQAPPLVAVVNNELYALEASTNLLKLYLKKSNRWKVLGEVPVRADCLSGWGVAFKSLGDELLVIGGGRDSSQHMRGYGISVYTTRPDPDRLEVDWRLVRVRGLMGPFVFNCAIMSA